MYKIEMVVYLRAAGEVLHEHGGHLGQVGGAARAGDVLVARAAQHGVQRVAHLVEQVVHAARRQQRRARPVAPRQRQHHHHYGVLTHTILITHAKQSKLAIYKKYISYMG